MKHKKKSMLFFHIGFFICFFMIVFSTIFDFDGWFYIGVFMPILGVFIDVARDMKNNNYDVKVSK